MHFCALWLRQCQRDFGIWANQSQNLSFEPSNIRLICYSRDPILDWLQVIHHLCWILWCIQSWKKSWRPVLGHWTFCETLQTFRSIPMWRNGFKQCKKLQHTRLQLYRSRRLQSFLKGTPSTSPTTICNFAFPGERVFTIQILLFYFCCLEMLWYWYWVVFIYLTWGIVM